MGSASTEADDFISDNILMVSEGKGCKLCLKDLGIKYSWKQTQVVGHAVLDVVESEPWALSRMLRRPGACRILMAEQVVLRGPGCCHPEGGVGMGFGPSFGRLGLLGTA